MRRRPLRALSLLLLPALGFWAACGKRADPLAPYLKTPLPPVGLEVSQIGEEVEVRILAPRTTWENRPLPVIQLEWSHGPLVGDFAKTRTTLVREEVAPGELRVKRFPRPLGEVRFSVRAFNGKAASVQGDFVAFKPAPVPSPPTTLEGLNTANGVQLRWANPPGAEPWPSPTPSPSPTPTPVPLDGVPSPDLTPTPLPTPPPAVPSPTEAPLPVGEKSLVALPGASPTAAPSTTVVAPAPSPTPPTGIRIFRTDGAPRLAREPLQASMWLDPLPKPGEKPCYALRYATSFKPLVESVSTEPVCVDVKDVLPPEPPGRLVGDI